MEKPTIYASAPKPPKQIRVEENPVETNVEQQDLAENKETPRSAITVMQPSAPKDTVVKLNTDAPNEATTATAENESTPLNKEPENAEPANDATATEEPTAILNVNIAEEDTNAKEPTNDVGETAEENAAEVKTDEAPIVESTSTKENTAIETESTEEEKLLVEETANEEITNAEVELPVDEKNELEEVSTTEEQINEEAQPVVNAEIEEPIVEAPFIETPELVPNAEAPISQETKATAEPKGEKAAKPLVSKQKAAETEHDFENLKIPGDDELFQRQYYTMGEVATMFHANQSQIRFWENEFDILQPKKNKKGDRYFRPEDVKNLQVIHHLLRNRRFTIEGAREYLKSNKQRTQDTVSAIASLNQLKSFLTELKANL